eukprot:g6153.t1
MKSAAWMALRRWVWASVREPETAKDLWKEHETAFKAADSYQPSAEAEWVATKWQGFVRPTDVSNSHPTGVDIELLRKIGERLCYTPQGFKAHPGLKRQLKKKLEDKLHGETIDWATAEALAFGTLLLEGNHVSSLLKLSAAKPEPQLLRAELANTLALELRRWRSKPKDATKLLTHGMQRVSGVPSPRNALAEKGHAATLVELLQVMTESQVPVNAFHLNVAIKACRRHKDWQRALQLLRAAPKMMLGGGSDLMNLSPDALRRHLETRVAHTVARARRRSSGARAQVSTTEPMTRDRNAGGRFFMKEDSWEKVGCLGERAMLPFVVKPRSPLPEHMREEMKREKEVIHTISMRFPLPRQPNGMVFSA